jgi:hypothetical protein
MQFRKIIAAAVIAILLAGCADTDAPIVVTTPAPSPTSAATETPTPTPSPTPVPTVEPEPTPEPYFTAEEQVTTDDENGYWLYSSPTLWVEVNRIFDSEEIITYFVAEIRCKPGVEQERGGFPTIGKPNSKNKPLYEIAQQYKAVIAVNGDFLDDNGKDPKGVIIRDGIVCENDDENQTLAFMPDGTLRVFEEDEITADELLAQGVMNSFSFGPVLINNCEIQDKLDKHYLRGKNPRNAVGVIEPYHYLMVVVDGRDGDYSKGMTLTELAELFASYHCEVAYNLDGGASAAMAFMGENISQFNGSYTGQRSSADALMFGTSDLVTADWP